MMMTGRVTAGREHARRPRGARARSSGDIALADRMLALQRSFGNRAVTSLVQRTCSGRGCCAKCAAGPDGEPAETLDGAAGAVQRQAVDVVSGADAHAPGTDPYVCSDPAEQTRKQAFGARKDLRLAG
jgi:hypothetical protein